MEGEQTVELLRQAVAECARSAEETGAVPASSSGLLLSAVERFLTVQDAAWQAFNAGTAIWSPFECFRSSTSNSNSGLSRQAGLAGNRAISADPWLVVTSIERAFPLQLAPAVEAAKVQAQSAKSHSLLQLWILQVTQVLQCALHML